MSPGALYRFHRSFSCESGTYTHQAGRLVCKEGSRQGPESPHSLGPSCSISSQSLILLLSSHHCCHHHLHVSTHALWAQLFTLPSAFYFSMVRATDGSHWGWQQETGKAWLHLTSTNLSPWAKMSSLRTCMSNSALEGDAVKYFGVVASLRGKVWSHFRDPDLFIKVRDLSDYCRGQKWKDLSQNRSVLISQNETDPF